MFLKVIPQHNLTSIHTHSHTQAAIRQDLLPSCLLMRAWESLFIEFALIRSYARTPYTKTCTRDHHPHDDTNPSVNDFSFSPFFFLLEIM